MSALAAAGLAHPTVNDSSVTRTTMGSLLQINGKPGWNRAGFLETFGLAYVGAQFSAVQRAASMGSGEHKESRIAHADVASWFELERLCHHQTV